jgi:predicted nuclease of predicted toxin-antitoxin system
VTCRLFLDQHIPLNIAEALRGSGHEALSVREAGLLGASDDLLLRFAAEQGRVFISSDYRDFARLSREWNQEARDFPGIVLVWRGESEYNPGEVVARVEQHITSDPTRLQNSLTWLPLLGQ